MSERSSRVPRREARQRAVELLYEADVRGVDARRLLDGDHAGELDAFSRDLVSGVVERRGELDGVIDAHAVGWRVERMAVVDRNILRVGAFELLHGAETPPAVAINEAVELAKSLGSDTSPRFVNGVLSAVLRDEAD